MDLSKYYIEKKKCRIFNDCDRYHLILIYKSNELTGEEKTLRYACVHVCVCGCGKSDIQTAYNFYLHRIFYVLIWIGIFFHAGFFFQIDIMALQIETNHVITKMTRHLNSIWTPTNWNQSYSFLPITVSFISFVSCQIVCVFIFGVYVLMLLFSVSF